MPPLTDAEMMSWAEIGRIMGISKKVAQRTGERAMAKLRAALEAEGITKEVFLAYLYMKEHSDCALQDNLAALLPMATTTTDDTDPKPWTKLRK